ncbi:substrate-binding domain-containing protein, partial [Arthrobacter sp. TB 26]|uniref:substrate-binding domain-containing protein n=1 Tax=Arthrobacter sp. TB 26 TaxID=494420 RepID=UPI0004A32E58
RDGFRSRIVEAGADVRIAGESQGTSEEDGYAAACWVVAHLPDTTALFAANDTLALGALAAAKARGLSVPGDLSVIGYDNSQLAKSRYLDMTSVDNRTLRPLPPSGSSGRTRRTRPKQPLELGYGSSRRSHSLRCQAGPGVVALTEDGWSFLRLEWKDLFRAQEFKGRRLCALADRPPP